MKSPKKSSVNAKWHKNHPMPQNPTLKEKIKWHQSHALHCGCRPIPASLVAEMKEQKPANFRKGKPDHTH